MSTISITVVVAATAIGLAAAPIRGPRPAAELVVSSVIYGRPDTLVANLKATTIGWSADAGRQSGAIRLQSGMFVIRHEQLTSGTFILDLQRRTAARAASGEHFALSARGGPRADEPSTAERVSPYIAVFQSTGAERVGPARWRVTGTISMNDVSRTISFDTDVQWPETGHMLATSTFTIDPRPFRVELVDASGRAATAPVQVTLNLDANRKQDNVVTR